MSFEDIFHSHRSGVAQILLEHNRQVVTGGTAFLVDGGLVTNSHALSAAAFDIAVFRFEEMQGGEGVRLARGDLRAAISYESPSDRHDVVFLELQEPEFNDRHRFRFSKRPLRVGQQIGFMGYPFQMRHLTCHLGNVSALYESAGIPTIQIDGSVNGGNSGGPLLSGDGYVYGIVTRANVGFVADQFDALIDTLQKNVDGLTRSGGGSISIGGVDPVAGLRVTQAGMREIAISLRRSANVGIGLAFNSDHICREVHRILKSQS